MLNWREPSEMNKQMNRPEQIIGKTNPRISGCGIFQPVQNSTHDECISNFRRVHVWDFPRVHNVEILEKVTVLSKLSELSVNNCWGPVLKKEVNIEKRDGLDRVLSFADTSTNLKPVDSVFSLTIFFSEVNTNRFNFAHVQVVALWSHIDDP